ncbi:MULTISPECIES: hypothetical protein [unclassified Leucobacter]|uniref:hypothetical protein n=1 Tax=unclassified Leucobacter TaxID=2621730 RepID=UPI000AED45E2|nr:hypothetical protein [Leucobacter sp. Ag1]
MQRVINEARRHGLALGFADLEPPTRAVFMADEWMIAISDKLDEDQAADSGAHELGHFVNGDRCSTPEAEERAWIYASRIRVDFHEYRDAELEDPHPLAIAQKLGTTRHIVELFQKHHLERLMLSAPRNIFGEYIDDGDEDALETRHSLAIPVRRSLCRLAS